MPNKKTERSAAKRPLHSYQQDKAAMDSFDRLLQLAQVAVTSPDAVLAVTGGVAGPAPEATPAVPAGNTEQEPSTKNAPDNDESSSSSDSEHTEFKYYSDGGASRMYGPPQGFKNWDQVYDTNVLGATEPGYSRIPQNPALPEPVGGHRPATPEGHVGEVLATPHPSPFKKPGKHRGEHSGTVMKFSDSDESPVKPKAKKMVNKKVAEAKNGLNRRVSALLHIRMPSKQSYDSRTRKTKTEASAPLVSPLFKFQGTCTETELLDTLAAQAKCVPAALCGLTWRFAGSKKGLEWSLVGDDAFEHLQEALETAKRDKVVEFWINPPVPVGADAHWTAPALAAVPAAAEAAVLQSPSAATASHASGVKITAAPIAVSTSIPVSLPAASNAHWASPAAGPVPDAPLMALGTGTFDEQLDTEAQAILAMYPAGRCSKHPGVHCYTHPRTGLCFDLSNKLRVKNWASNNLRHSSTRHLPPIGNQFFDVQHAVKNKPAAQSASLAGLSNGFMTPPHGFATPPPVGPYGGHWSPYGYPQPSLPPAHYSPYAAPAFGTGAAAYTDRAQEHRASSPPPIEPDTDAAAFLRAAGMTEQQVTKLLNAGYTAGQPLSTVGKDIWTEAGFKAFEWHSMCAKDKKYRRELKALLL